MIRYIFTMDRGKVVDIEVNPDEISKHPDGDGICPYWTRLEYGQCDHCTLSTDIARFCPAAKALSHIMPKFSEIVSFEPVDVRVITPEREYLKHCDVQTALRSLIGYVMATSDCPYLMKLRPMAEFHLPFASGVETSYRTACAYLLKQYFIYRDGGQPDLELKELKQLYRDLRTLNRCFTGRIREAAVKDANLNAVVKLFSLSVLVTRSLEHELDEFRRLYR